MAPLSWFRTGGRADVLFMPADENDLSSFLAGCPGDVPIHVVGLGSNLLVRDGGVPGAVIRLGRGFSWIRPRDDRTLSAGAGAPDVKVARAAAEAGIDGLAFLRGIPGAIGGALRMNGGAYGGETADVLLEARALDRQGRAHVLSPDDMRFAYRRCGAPGDLVFTAAVFRGREGDPAAILAAMAAITDQRSATQPVNTRTGGSTFKNPPGRKAWELVDQAGCRGLRIGDAQVSDLHCNFLINHGVATAAEIEGLGEEVRRRVRETTGVELEWEIKRIGTTVASGGENGPAASTGSDAVHRAVSDEPSRSQDLQTVLVAAAKSSTPHPSRPKRVVRTASAKISDLHLVCSIYVCRRYVRLDIKTPARRPNGWRWASVPQHGIRGASSA